MLLTQIWHFRSAGIVCFAIRLSVQEILTKVQYEASKTLKIINSHKSFQISLKIVPTINKPQNQQVETMGKGKIVKIYININFINLFPYNIHH